MYVRMYVCMYKHISAYMHIHIYIYMVCIYIYIHTCAKFEELVSLCILDALVSKYIAAQSAQRIGTGTLGPGPVGQAFG